MKDLKFGFVILVALTLSFGCKTSEKTTSDTSVTGGTIQMELVASSSSSSKFSQAVGQASSTNLTSLKYFIRDIKICETLTVSGFGYYSQSGCLSLFNNSLTADYDTFLADDASTDTTNYIDLMTT